MVAGTNGRRRPSNGNGNKREGIAIVGVGCRLPGGVSTLDGLWEILMDGRSAIIDLPDGRWDRDAYYHPDRSRPGKLYTQMGGYIEGIDQFDANFFGISPREAERIDPQHRLLLEMSWEALEDAGQSPERTAGTSTGVFIGLSSSDYGHLQAEDADNFNAYNNVGTAASIAANRISYSLDLHGPSFVVDTACSSSLVAMHQACESIWRGESAMALTGGVNLVLLAMSSIGFCKASMLSPTSRCHSFDAAGDGYVRAEGGAVVLLKPLSRAVEDGDRIYGVIRGAGTNSDGRTAGIFLPSETAQAQLLRDVYSQAGISTADVTYVEAHGTGTLVGDPIECNAIGSVMGANRNGHGPCMVGSVKASIGHLEPAAGMAGVLKVLLTLEHGMIPPTAGIEELNPNIPYDDLGLHVVTEPTPLAKSKRPHVMGVNSFGFGGTNAHVAIEEYREPASRKKPAPLAGADPLPLMISARDENALAELVASYRDMISNADDSSVYDICYGAALRRGHLTDRLVIFGEGRNDLLDKIDQYGAGEFAPGVVQERAIAQSARLALVFSGNGPQWWGMGQELLANDPIFRATVEEIDSIHARLADWSLLDELRAGENDSHMEKTEYAQPALFAVQLGILAVLRARGIEAEAAVGHSVGEVAAAYAAGALSLEQAVRVIHERSQAQAPTAGAGKMAALGMSEEDAAELIAPYKDKLVIGAVNSASSVTISGDPQALEFLGEELERRGTFYRILDLDYAFHSTAMDPIRAGLVAGLKGLKPSKSRMSFVSTVTGGPLGGTRLGPRYWWDNVRKPVRFAEAIEGLIDDGIEIFLEIGPHPVLATYLGEAAREKSSPAAAVATLRRDDAEAESLLTCVARCHALGAVLDIEAMFPVRGRRIELPRYPWQRERHWGAPEDTGADHPLLGDRDPGSEPSWINRLDTPKVDFLQDHKVQTAVVFPAAGFLEMALSAASLGLDGVAFELEDVDIRKALVIPEGVLPEVQTKISGENGSFRISSRASRDDKLWTEHSVGKVGRLASTQRPSPHDIQALQAGATEILDKEQHYRIAAACELNYGPLFQGVKKIWARPGEALGQIVAPRRLRGDLGDYILHPALLDSCFQVVLGMVVAEVGVTERAAYLPVQIKRMKYYGPGKPIAYCRTAVEREGVRSVIAELQLLDSKGGVIADISGFRFQRVDLARQAVADAPLYEYRAQPQPNDAVGNAPATSRQFSLDALRARMAEKIGSLVERHDRAAFYRNIQPRVDSLCAAFAARVLEALDARSGPFTAASLMLPPGDREEATIRINGATRIEPGPRAKARAALQTRDHATVAEYLEDALRPADLEAWPCTSTGRLKVDRRTLKQFETLPVIAALLQEDEAAVLPYYEALLDRIIAMLAEDKLVRKYHSAWRLVSKDRMPDADEMWRAFLAEHPAHLPEMILLARCAENMVRILRGELEPLEIISRGMLEHIYESSPDTRFYNEMAAELLGGITAAWPETRPLRILEIGAGTGGLTSWLLPRLPRHRTEYVYTDVGDVFLGEAEARFADYPFVRFGLLNIERDPADQDYAPESFDIVIAANVLHATNDIRQTLANARGLLADGGILMLMETHEQRILDMIFGMLKGWWAFQDHDIRPDSALLAPNVWPAVLADTGFSEIECFNDDSVDSAPRQSVFIARRSAEEKPADAAPTFPTDARRGWLVLADREDGFGGGIATMLAAEGHRVVTAYAGDGFQRVDETTFSISPGDPGAMDRLVRLLRDERAGCEEIVLGWGLDSANSEDGDGPSETIERRCLPAIHLLRAYQQTPWPNMPRLWLLTSGAVAHPGRRGGIVPVQAALWGLGRVIANEHPELRPKMVDLDPQSDSASVVGRLLNEFVMPDDEDELLIGGDARFVNRVRRTSVGELSRRFKAAQNAGGAPQSFALDFTSQGALDNLYLRAVPTPTPGPGQVLVEVKAAGLNFRDVMWAMGMLPGEALEGGFAGPTLGMECAGVVAACGEGVTGFAPGDKVLAFAGACFSSHILAEPKALAPVPTGLGFEEAATIPTVFFTAYYALETLGRLEPGEKVLIHGAAGGVGLAAIQIAKQIGAEVFATAGTAEKRDFVRMLGADHVLDSRSLSFADDVMRITEGDGIDVVLNSLAGEAIHKNLNLLKPFGRFLEIGKRDLYANSKMGLRPFRNNISYFAIDADQLMVERPDLARRLFREVIEKFEHRTLHPIVHRTFPVGRIVEAFRHMQQSRHIGKIIVSMEQTDGLEIVSADRETLELRADASYLVTGGLSGFGLATARWMADKGARNLILMGRRGVATAEARAGVAALEQAGVKVHVAKCDVADDAALGRALDAASDMPPVRGVVHAAMVLDDAILLQLDRERMDRAIRPKVMGAWNLHRRTQAHDLDFFVLYSSATGLIGNPGQGNYVAANLYLEALAQHRRSMGLPGLAVGWGAIDDVGYVARRKDIKEQLESHSGLRAIASSKALDALEQLILTGAESVTAADLNWPKTLKVLPSATVPRYAYVTGQEAEDGGGEMLEGLADLLFELPPEERLETVVQLVAEQVGKILRTSAAKLDVNRSLLEMGIDSLMGVEMQMTIEKQFGVEIPTMELMGGISITQIAHRILDKVIGDAPAPAPSAQAQPDEDLIEEMTQQVDELSDEAIDAYLEELQAETSGAERHAP